MESTLKSKLERIETLSKKKAVLEERIKRITELNKYDHSRDGGRSAFTVEFGGGSTSTKMYITDNEEGNEITEFFVNRWTKESEAVLKELMDLVK